MANEGKKKRKEAFSLRRHDQENRASGTVYLSGHRAHGYFSKRHCFLPRSGSDLAPMTGLRHAAGNLLSLLPRKVDTSKTATEVSRPRCLVGRRFGLLLGFNYSALIIVLLHSVVPTAALDALKELKVGKDGIADCTRVSEAVEFKAKLKGIPPVSRVTLKCPPNSKVIPPDPSKEACESEACYRIFPLALGHGLLGNDTCITAEGHPTAATGITWTFDMRKYIMWSELLDDLLEADFYFRCDAAATPSFPGGLPCLLKIEVDIERQGSGTRRRENFHTGIVAAFVLLTTLVTFL